MVEICQWAHTNGLRTHLDGARLFNAVATTGIEAATWSQHFETVSVCFSKGLGAPVGSALAGPKEMIREARRHRKLFGGAMRQAGIIAAALFTLVSPRTEAANFTWATSTGFWTNGPSWGGAAPSGSSVTGISDILNFAGDVGPTTLYTTTNNSPVVPFTLNQIICNALDATIPATTNAHTVDGGTLRWRCIFND